jgi:hypothetical protein
MGLKKDSPATGAESSPAAGDESTQQVESRPAAVKPAAAKPAPVKAKADTTMLRAVHTWIADPTTAVKYVTSQGTPGVVKEGNWLDCQIKAGVLVVCPNEADEG